jgi:hypothetical protein
MSVYSVLHAIILDSVWCVFGAISQVPEFYIEYPKSPIKQKAILGKDLKRRAMLAFLIAQVVLMDY